jgi:hypothetical protein
MEKSTQPRGLASLKKSLKTQQTSSPKLAFDYDKEEDDADKVSKSKVYQSVVKNVLARYDEL